MPVPSSPEAFKIHDAGSYDPLVDSFQALTERFTKPIADRLLELATPLADQSILDVGCGTGVLTLAAAALKPPPRAVTGLDLSAPMLVKALALAERAKLDDTVVFKQGDAEHLEFADASFDTIVSLYALRHFPDPQSALHEMVRVVRPGGVIVVGVGSAPPMFSRGFIAAVGRRGRDAFDTVRGARPLSAPAFLDALVDELWGRGDHSEHAQWTQGVHHYAASVADMMATAGCVDLQTRWFGNATVIQSIEDFWGLQSTLSSYARKRIGAATSTDVESLRGEFTRRCQTTLANGGSMVYRSGALVTRASRPAGNLAPPHQPVRH